jgi:hypothetical protein
MYGAPGLGFQSAPPHDPASWGQVGFSPLPSPSREPPRLTGPTPSVGPSSVGAMASPLLGEHGPPSPWSPTSLGYLRSPILPGEFFPSPVRTTSPYLSAENLWPFAPHGQPEAGRQEDPSDSRSSVDSNPDLSLFDHGDYHLLVCGWNINDHPMDSIWVQELYAHLSQRRPDALFLIDTRTPSDPYLLGVAKRYLIANLGDEYMVYVSPGCSSGVPGRNEWVGGVTLVIRKQVFTGWTVSKLYLDPLGCAMYLAADLHHSDGRRARLMGVYLPLVSLDPPPARPSVSSSVETQASHEPSPLAPSALLSLASSAAPKTPSVPAFATKVRLFFSSLPSSPDRPASAEAWFWHCYEVLSRDQDWKQILVGGFNRS